MKLLKNNSKAFTLIELLLVVAVIGILAGVTVTVINPQKQKDIAEDAVRLSNVEKLVAAIEAYYAAEGQYPPENPTSDAAFMNYITAWPEPTSAGDTYEYWVSADRQSFTVLVVKALWGDSKDAYKYNTSYGKIQICKNIVVSNSSCN